MSHFYAGWKEGDFPEATQNPDSSKRKFQAFRFQESRSFYKTIVVLPFALTQCANIMSTSERIIKSFVKPNTSKMKSFQGNLPVSMKIQLARLVICRF